ncbi:TPA: hypothetical protein QDA99_006573 [Burkholderia vietnamiensis]|uniref:hypothetical protein n=1 Tax=Burkholderia vietnamiensis TaxID=60552 RepID=UPI00158EDE5A|nr:hypothetical protein [Burkholderia vietnamiensis]HDR9003064.1 hypothetical protein [Burkholderia vietnamiensis]HDR9006892.1 hypothetical protein [Burkholderia vietnamiensis]
MDRQIVYAGQIPLETDLLNTNRNAYTALGMLIQDMFGTSTVFSGLGCVPTSPAGMTVNVNPGRVYSLQQRDPAAYSSLGQDTTNQIMKQGVLLSATNFSCPAPATSGYSVNYLISASFLEQDTNAVVLPYYNSTNPSQAFSGPPVNGQSSGTAQNTTRQDTIQLTLTAGVAATTGSQQTPATPTGQIPLWVITVSYGQSSITASSISAVSGSPFAPTGGYFQAVGERYSSIINATSTQTLTTAALGALVNITATGTTQTLPPASACPNGTSITLVYMQSSGSATVTRNGTDALSFGQGSSANSITLSPGEEVQFVSNGANGWVSAGQTLSTGVTPPQFDSSAKLATTAFVKGVGPSFSLEYQIVATGVIPLSAIGGLAIFNPAGAVTATLPSASSVPVGATITFFNVTNYACTVARNGTDVIGVNAGTVTSISLGNGDTLTLESNGVGWRAIGGSAQLQYSSLAALGPGQALQNLTASRVLNTNYTNTTTKPVIVYATASGGAAGSAIGFFTGGCEGAISIATAAGNGIGVMGIAMPGAAYSVGVSGSATLQTWYEIR